MQLTFARNACFATLSFWYNWTTHGRTAVNNLGASFSVFTDFVLQTDVFQAGIIWIHPFLIWLITKTISCLNYY